jgi:hypothetical protein
MLNQMVVFLRKHTYKADDLIKGRKHYLIDIITILPSQKLAKGFRRQIACLPF